jgi:hypothetical protein
MSTQHQRDPFSRLNQGSWQEFKDLVERCRQASAALPSEDCRVSGAFPRTHPEDYAPSRTELQDLVPSPSRRRHLHQELLGIEKVWRGSGANGARIYIADAAWRFYSQVLAP